MPKFNGSSFARKPLWLLSKIALLYIVLGVVLRLVLIFMPQTQLGDVAWYAYPCFFLVGAVSDLLVSVVLLLPLVLFILSIGTWRFSRPQCFIGMALLVVAEVLLLTCGGPVVEFNKGLYRVLCYLGVVWFATFALRTFLPTIRRRWTLVWLSLICATYLGIIILDFVGECFFWNEFGVRYNFIAVDYLIYTNEVVGNIFESYPMWAIIPALLVVVAVAEWFMLRYDIVECTALDTVKGWRVILFLIYISLFNIALFGIPYIDSLNRHENVFAREIQASGPYSFLKAFCSNELNFPDFYPTNSAETVETDVAAMLAPVASDSTATVRHPNIVLVTMESMSADYMEHFGDTRHLTPALDSLYDRSLAFNRMFANGNRTVRGLEAVTLSRPPSPGESIVKRPNNAGYHSIADVLRREGYDLTFLYGGDSYFDNMGSFFGNLGYRIVDSKAFDPSEVNFRTVWGVCDGDVYTKLLKLADEATDRPFFIHVMTTSNHRPYTYPDGVIDIPPSAKSRRGGVKYSDFALGDFISNAAGHLWFDNTVFVIVADHCASSAGKVDIPLGNYHIPALIYAPALIEPATVDHTTSQIDLLPTLFALLGWKPDNQLMGRNVLAPDYQPRAYIATYQDMGYLAGDTLSVISPGKKSRQFVVSPEPADPFATRQIAPTTASTALRQAVSIYQHSSTTK